jgi:hypothetical protein
LSSSFSLPIPTIPIPMESFSVSFAIIFPAKNSPLHSPSSRSPRNGREPNYEKRVLSRPMKTETSNADLDSVS